MSSEKLSGNHKERRDWKVEREQELASLKKKIGKIAIESAAVVAVVATVLAHGVKTKEIMNDEERAKNVKRIEAEGAIFHDGVNARKEPFVDNTGMNKLGEIGEEGESVVVDYNGEVCCFVNENDPNGGWYGFDAGQLSDELLAENRISQTEANNLKSDEKYGDGIVWFNEKYVTIIEPEEMGYTMTDEANENS